MFVAGAVLFGFGLLGWSGSVLLGNGVENAKRHLDLNTDWTEADSRRAMARFIGVGVGLMAGVALVGSLLLAVA